MVGGKQGMDIKGNGETCREGGVTPVFQMANGYGMDIKLQNLPRKLCQMKKKISFTCFQKCN